MPKKGWQCRASEVETLPPQGLLVALIETNDDLEEERKVSVEEGAELAEEFGCAFHQVSSKTQQNVHEVFDSVARRCRDERIVRIAEEKEYGIKMRLVKARNTKKPRPFAVNAAPANALRKYLREVKMLLVGDSNVGQESLLTYVSQSTIRFIRYLSQLT